MIASMGKSDNLLPPAQTNGITRCGSSHVSAIAQYSNSSNATFSNTLGAEYRNKFPIEASSGSSQGRHSSDYDCLEPSSPWEPSVSDTKLHISGIWSTSSNESSAPASSTDAILAQLPPSSELFGGAYMSDWQHLVSATTAYPTAAAPLLPVAGGTVSQLTQAGNPGLSEGMIRELASRLSGNLSSNGRSSHGGSPVCNPHRSGMEKALNFSHGWNATDHSSLGLTLDPSKGGLSLQGVAASTVQCLSRFPTNSSFAERAARFSKFGNGSYSQSLPLTENAKVRHSSHTLDNESSPAKSSLRSPRMESTGTRSAAKSETASPSSLVPQVHGNPAEAPGRAGKSPKVDHKVNRLYRTSSNPPVVDRKDGDHCREANIEEDGAARTCNSAAESEDPSNIQETSGPEQTAADRVPGGPCETLTSKRKSSADADSKDAGCSAGHPHVRDVKDAALQSKRQKGGDGLVDREDVKPKAERSSSENSESLSPRTGKENLKSPEQPKLDYIHVRARRGQATDSHSLAERVRREKISERMKYLQDLVPGCSKVTGKAVMLDEIINYVQSIQRQVELLSMKLAAVTPQPDFNMDSFLTKEVGAGIGSVGNSDGNLAYPQLHSQPQGVQLQHGVPCGVELQSSGNIMEAALRRMNSNLPSSRSFVDVFADSMGQVPRTWDGELQSVVQMGFSHSRPDLLQSGLHCDLPPGHMKVEM